MKITWFNDHFKSIFTKIGLTSNEVQDALKLIKEISIANGGEICDHSDMEETKVAAYAVLKAREAIQRRMNAYARVIAESGSSLPQYGKTTADSDYNGLSFVIPKHLSPKVNLNSASINELSALPGIGNTTAARIVEYRHENGPFVSIEEVKRVKGIGNQQLEQFRNIVFAGDTGARTRLSCPEIEAFVRQPSLDAYADLLVGPGILFPHTEVTATMSPSGVILSELRDILNDTKINPSPSSMITDSIHANYVLDLKARSRALQTQSFGAGSLGRLILDSLYPRFVRDLIKESAASLCIIMFFMRYVKERDYPTDELISEIVKAKERGVFARVILDKDAEGEVYGSRIINREVYEHFVNKNIEVRYDTMKKVTHTKLVVSDGRHVVLGSHNWTGGSFFAYDDTSVYIDSTELAKFYEDEFERRWNEYE